LNVPRISKFTEEQQKAAVDACNRVAEGQTKGARVSEVAKDLGISTGTLGIWMRKANGTENGTAVSKRPRGRPKAASAPSASAKVQTTAAAGTGDVIEELMRIRAEIQRLKDRMVQLVLS
jgi:transposase-like protein